MKIFKYIGISLFASSLLFASTELSDKAIKAGLKAIR